MGLLMLVALSSSRLLAGGGFLSVHPEGLLNGWELAGANNDPMQAMQHIYYVNPAYEPYAVNRINYNPQLPDVDADLLQGEQTDNNPRILSSVNDGRNPFSGPLSYGTKPDEAMAYLHAHGWDAILIKIGKAYPHLMLESIQEDRLVFLGGISEMNPFPNDPSFSLIDLPTNLPRCMLVRNNPAEVDWMTAQADNSLIDNNIQQQITAIPDNIEQEIVWLDEEDFGNTGAVLETNADLSEEPEAAATEEVYKQEEAKESAILEIQVWPNPTRGEFQVEIQRLEEEALTFQVLSTEGQVLASKAGVNGAVRFDISQYAAGIYYVRTLSVSGRSWSKPVVLQR